MNAIKIGGIQSTRRLNPFVNSKYSRVGEGVDGTISGVVTELGSPVARRVADDKRRMVQRPPIPAASFGIQNAPFVAHEFLVHCKPNRNGLKLQRPKKLALVHGF